MLKGRIKIANFVALCKSLCKNCYDEIYIKNSHKNNATNQGKV